VKYVYCIIRVNKALHCVIKCSQNIVEVTKLRRKGLAEHVACMGGFRNYMLCRSEKLNGRESSSLTVVHSSMEEISLGP
jgi:hypothetical protein